MDLDVLLLIVLGDPVKKGAMRSNTEFQFLERLERELTTHTCHLQEDELQNPQCPEKNILALRKSYIQKVLPVANRPKREFLKAYFSFDSAS